MITNNYKNYNNLAVRCSCHSVLSLAPTGGELCCLVDNTMNSYRAVEKKSSQIEVTGKVTVSMPDPGGTVIGSLFLLWCRHRSKSKWPSAIIHKAKGKCYFLKSSLYMLLQSTVALRVSRSYSKVAYLKRSKSRIVHHLLLLLSSPTRLAP